MQRAYVDALCREMAERRGEAEHHAVPTVYFGGGTPSMLPDDALEQVLTALRSAFHVIDEAELTLEANPDLCRTYERNAALSGDGHRVFPAGALRPAENTEQEGYTLVRGRV